MFYIESLLLHILVTEKDQFLEIRSRNEHLVPEGREVVQRYFHLNPGWNVSVTASEKLKQNKINTQINAAKLQRRSQGRSAALRAAAWLNSVCVSDRLACCVCSYRTWRAQSALHRLTWICSRAASVFLLTAGRRCFLSDSCCCFPLCSR